MSVRSKRFELRLSVHERERYEAAAKARGLDISEWIRDACDKYADLEAVVREPLPPGLRPDPPPTLTKPARRIRAKTCEHRIGPGSFCKVCD